MGRGTRASSAPSRVTTRGCSGGYVWDATAGDHVVRVRATDGDGATQTDAVAPPAPNGATGWPSRRLRVR